MALLGSGLGSVRLTPLDTVPEFERCLRELSESCNAQGFENIAQKCEELSRAADQLINVMMWQYRTHPLQLAGVSDAFRLSINRILQLKGLVMNMDSFIRERELGNTEDDNKSEALSLDAPSLVPKNYTYRKLRDWEESSMISSTSSLASGRLTPGKAISVEDFKKALLPNLLSRSLPGKGQAEHLASEVSSVAGSEDPSEDIKGRRKAKSEDLHVRDLSQKIESLKVDNTRLRDSERKLLKETVVLKRTCKTLEQERDRAENRLKVEQTQRDSIQKLRERNAQLESQLQELCKLQTWREEERQKANQQENPPPDT